MGHEPVERRLAAIMVLDVVGYSRLMGMDELATLAALRQVRTEVLSPLVRHNHGRIVKLMGDGAIVVFGSVVDAVQCAIAVQQSMPGATADLPADRKIRLRIGVNLGDVIIEGADLYGDGVNVAARLQEVAEPGGVAISGTVQEHAAGRVPVVFRDLGDKAFKNIARPIRVYGWRTDATEEAAPLGRRDEGLPVPDRPSIAVLPFDNLSGDPEQEYFADGIVESITAALSRIRSFFVIARNSAFTYKGRHVNVRDVGRELGVAYVLEGSVQRAGGRVRITVQLVETAGGAHLWAEKCEGAVDDIFELQDRITEQVAGALQPSIRFAEIERVLRKHPQELGAYDLTMRAMRHVWMLEKDEAARALDLLEEALAIDPDYPLALGLAAWCWAQRSVYNWVTDIGAALDKAIACAERAASLSTDDPLILAVLGAAHTFARNFGTARVLLERATSIDPNAAWALSRLGWLEVYAGRPEAARQHFEHALRLSPLDPMNFNNFVGLASASQVDGDDARAAELFKRALQERPNADWIHRNLAPALLASGNEAEARDSCRRLLAAYPNFTIAQFRSAMVFSPEFLERIGTQLRALGVPER